MIDKDVLKQHAIHGGTSWLKRVGLSDSLSKTERMVCKYLPRKNPITLHTILRFDGISVDWLVAIIAAGGLTLPGQDWRKVLRIALAKRLKANKVALYRPPFDKIVDTLLEYQLEGGKLAVRDKMVDRARVVYLHPAATPLEAMIAQLIFSICHEHERKALTEPFHWLKMVLAREEQFSAMGVQCYKKEDAAMKAAIILALVSVDT